MHKIKTIKKIIDTAVKLESFILGMRYNTDNLHVVYHDDENEMWARGSLVRLKIATGIYEECIKRSAKIWGLGRSDITNTLDVYISDDRCMFQLECYRREGESRLSKDVILLEFNFEKGYAVCDICELRGIKYCYCVTLLGATKLLTDWIYCRHRGRCDYFFASSWEGSALTAEDILSGGLVVCDGKVKKLIKNSC